MKNENPSYKMNEIRSGKRTLWHLLPVLTILMVVTMACSISMGGPQPPENRAPVENPNGDWRSILENAQPGEQVTLTLTEQELTQMAASSSPSAGEVALENPRVILDDGLMQVYGRASTQGISGNFRLDIDVKVVDGKPDPQIVAADFGGIPVPSSLRDQLESQIDSLLTGAIGNLSSRFRVETITISDGLMTINGTVQ